jgi:hypothetical protein
MHAYIFNEGKGRTVVPFVKYVVFIQDTVRVYQDPLYNYITKNGLRFDCLTFLHISSVYMDC